MARAGVAVLLAATLAACARAAGSPENGAGEPRQASAGAASRPPHTAADVEFIQGMITHHRQALAMNELVDARTRNGTIHLLAQRIEVSQTDEIAQMSRWLERHGEAVPSAAAPHAGHEGHSAMMPGMLTEQEMAELAAAQGTTFDRRFLELMIRHHEGALTMVGTLFATPGAGQDVDIFRIASEVDSDQRIEIERMRRMLESSG